MSNQRQPIPGFTRGPQPAGPPFIPTSADNGLSVDLNTGRIVLGNDVGDVVATLLSNREIPTGGFNTRFTDSSTNKYFQISGNPSEAIASEANFDGAFFGYNSQQLNAGIASANFIQLYTQQHAAILGSTSTAHTAGFEPNAAFLYGVANGGAALLWILAENGIRFAPDGITSADVAMSIFGTSKNVRIANDQVDNGEKLQVDGNATLAGAITTGDPGSGIAPVRLGTIVAAVSVLDAARYWEVMINGVMEKVALIT